MTVNPSTTGPLLTVQGASILTLSGSGEPVDLRAVRPACESDNAAKKVVPCCGCDQPICFEPPVPGDPVGMWICKTCGAVYYGDDAEDAAAHAFGVVRAVGLRSHPLLGGVDCSIDARISSIPPAYVQRLVSSLAGDVYNGPERRLDRRYQMAVPVVAVPLDADLKVAGEPLRMTTKDISLGGVSLIHTRFMERPYFALDFTAAGIQHVQVTLEVVSVRNFGPVYEIGGQFICRAPEKSRRRSQFDEASPA